MSVYSKKHLFLNIIFATISVGLILFGVLLLVISTTKIPDFKSFEERRMASSTKIYDRTGTIVLYDLHENVKRTVIPLEDMGEVLPQAVIAVEDADFYEHRGIRPLSIIRMIIVNITSGTLRQGGSTITQQLVKMTLLTNEKTVIRKLKEWVLAVKIEQTLDKNSILELYLNEAPFGGPLYGVQDASQAFFSKNPKELSIAEAAYLAAIPQRPTYFSPYGNNRDALDQRQRFVLKRMYDVGFLTEEQYTEALQEKVVFNKERPIGIKAPHFVFFIQNYLESRYGNDVLQTGGLKVITTLDYTLQEKAEEILYKNALEAEKNNNASNQALVAIDPKTGQILTMVGSRGYFDKGIDGNFNVATARRQPGSSFKPFIYAKAFENGFTPETVVFDVFTEFSTRCTAYGVPIGSARASDCYHPSNFDNTFRGPITLRNALQQSINVPAVKMLYLVGVDEAINFARSLGVRLEGNREQYGLTVVLGGGEVSLLDMTSAYGVFANKGVRNTTTGILRIENNQGKILESYEQSEERVLSSDAAAFISNVLSDNTARIPTFGSRSSLFIEGRQVAAKTGTTNDNKDAWLIGYTPTIAAGVWAGNNDNTPMRRGGAAVAGPSWNEFMRFALSRLPEESFDTPPSIPETLTPILRGEWLGGESFVIDTISGGLATEFTPIETREEKVITQVHSILHWVDRRSPRTIPDTPSNDPQYRNWERTVQDWWQKNKGKYPIITRDQKPSFFDNVHTKETLPVVTITTPQGTILRENTPLTLQIQTQQSYPIQTVELYINNILIETKRNTPYVFTVTPELLPVLQEENSARVIVTDSVYNRGDAVITLTNI